MNALGFERQRAAIICRAFFPATAMNGVTKNRDLGASFAEQVAAAPWYAALLVRFAFLFVWFAPLFTRLRTFGGLGDDARTELLEKYIHSNNYVVRQMMMMLKITVCSAALGDEAILTQIGAYRLALVSPAVRKAS